MDKKDENELLIKLCNEDETAFTSFYKMTYPMVLTYIIRNKGTQEDAMDFMQEAFIVLIKNLRENNFRKEAKLSSYFLAIVKFLWLDHLRKLGQKSPSKSADIEDIPITFLIDDDMTSYKEEREEILDLLENAMNKLEKVCQQLLMKFYYEKKQLIVIADELGYTQNFVKIKKGRCLDSLNQLLKAKNK